jgi:hypothetical protein
MTCHFEHWHNLTLHQNRVNLGQLKVNFGQNLDKVVKNKGLMLKELIYDKWNNDKKWEILKWSKMRKIETINFLKTFSRWPKEFRLPNQWWGSTLPLNGWLKINQW